MKVIAFQKLANKNDSEKEQCCSYGTLRYWSWYNQNWYRMVKLAQRRTGTAGPGLTRVPCTDRTVLNERECGFFSHSFKLTKGRKAYPRTGSPGWPGGRCVVLLMRYLGTVWDPGCQREQVGALRPPIGESCDSDGGASAD